MEDGKPRAILVVEDEAIIAMAQTMKLRHFGYRVLTAESGEQAVALALADREIGLVLMDIDLGGGMDGTEAASRILAGRDLPIVFLTAHAERGFVDKVKRITRYGYVFKDSSDFVLESAIEMAFALFREHELAREREARLERAELISGFGSWEFDLGAGTVFASRGARSIYGLGSEEWTIAAAQRIPLPEHRAALDAALAALVSGAAPYDIEFEIERPSDGERRRIHSVARYEADRRIVTGTIHDVTEERRAAEAARREARTFAAMLSATPDGFFLADAAGLLLEANGALARMLGRPRGEILGRPFADFAAAGSGAEVEEVLARVRDLGAARFEARLAAGDSGIIDVELSAMHLGEEGRLLAFVRDLGPRRAAERAGALALELLGIESESPSLREYGKRLAPLLRQWSGCTAAGIRLREGEDYPYVQSGGFPPGFEEAEGSLCRLGGDGLPLRDEAARPRLACLCGRVLRGEDASGLPGFSAGGSFWTNRAGELLASGALAGVEALRGRCLAEGFQSLALVPIRSRGEVIGLLQFNDRRPDRYSHSDIEAFERVAALVGAALTARQGRSG